jgi:hypothetical protein
MQLHQGAFNPWLPPKFRHHLLDLQAKILEADDLLGLWQEILVLSFILFFSGHRDEAIQVLEGYFDVCPVERRGNTLFWSSTSVAVEEIKALEMLLHFAPRQPRNYPWIPLSDSRLREPRFDIAKPEFFQLDNWTNTEWIPSTDYGERLDTRPIDENYDGSRWQDSDDPWTHAICARVLCHEPSTEAVEEAFGAVDKLFTILPKRKNPRNANDEWPHSHIFPVKIYFLLAVGLNKRGTARKILQRALRTDEFTLQELLEVPAAYEIFLDPELQGVAVPTIISVKEGARAASVLTDAFEKRLKDGQQEPLQGIEWPELLRRFSEAAFKVHGDAYEEVEDEEIEKPSDILLPPITAEALAEIEQKLGPLPQDLKDMVLVANGFKGGWHFAGGGWAGVDKLRLEYPSEYEIYLGVEPPTERSIETITNPDGTTRQVMKHIVSFTGKPSGVEWGPVYACWGAVENDGFNHILCPHETWKKIKGGNVRDGEYRVIHYAHWTAGPQGEYNSMRHWIASMTAEMERELAGEEQGIDA